jgi:hypothetical protein
VEVDDDLLMQSVVAVEASMIASPRAPVRQPPFGQSSASQPRDLAHACYPRAFTGLSGTRARERWAPASVTPSVRCRSEPAPAARHERAIGQREQSAHALRKKNATAFRKLFDRYVKAAASTNGSKPKREFDIAQSREWARANDVTVPARGRIRQAVVDQYKHAGGR